MAEKTYDVTELFGSDVFNEAVMKARLPKAIFKELMKVMHGNAELTLPIAKMARRSCQHNEGLGSRKGCNTLHSLVPAYDRYHSRKARQLYFTCR